MAVETTDEKVLATLRAVVEERPDHVYTVPEHMPDTDMDGGKVCYYVHVDEEGKNPQPGCLVGTVFHRLGVPLSALAEWENHGAYSVTEKVLEGVSGDVRNRLDGVQYRQDSGASWSEALTG